MTLLNQQEHGQPCNVLYKLLNVDDESRQFNIYEARRNYQRVIRSLRKCNDDPQAEDARSAMSTAWEIVSEHMFRTQYELFGRDKLTELNIDWNKLEGMIPYITNLHNDQACSQGSSASSCSNDTTGKRAKNTEQRKERRMAAEHSKSQVGTPTMTNDQTSDHGLDNGAEQDQTIGVSSNDATTYDQATAVETSELTTNDRTRANGTYTTGQAAGRQQCTNDLAEGDTSGPEQTGTADVAYWSSSVKIHEHVYRRGELKFRCEWLEHPLIGIRMEKADLIYAHQKGALEGYLTELRRKSIKKFRHFVNKYTKYTSVILYKKN